MNCLYCKSACVPGRRDCPGCGAAYETAENAGMGAFTPGQFFVPTQMGVMIDGQMVTLNELTQLTGRGVQ